MTCHLDGHDGVILAGPSKHGRAAPHALRRTPAFASLDACAGCHEFWFPHAGRDGSNLKMQRTISEHARSDYADDSCQSCHMTPQGSGEARHPPALHDRQLRWELVLERALDASAGRDQRATIWDRTSFASGQL